MPHIRQLIIIFPAALGPAKIDLARRSSNCAPCGSQDMPHPRLTREMCSTDAYRPRATKPLTLGDQYAVALKEEWRLSVPSSSAGDAAVTSCAWPGARQSNIRHGALARKPLRNGPPSDVITAPAASLKACRRRQLREMA